ncbi:MAG: thiol-disulfide oxidoreductase DCC family protein [Gammaproteobacteria bacterium]
MKMQSSESKLNFPKDSPHLVFYDDRCSLCTAEINHYQKLETCHPIQWIGIHKNRDIVQQHSFTQKQLLERLHVVQGNGETHIGASAFITIWLSIKRYRVVGLMVKKLRLTPILNYFYEPFAKRRYQKRICKI